MRSTFFFVLPVILATAQSVAAQEVMSATRFVEIEQLSAPSLSPDGRLLALRHSQADWAANDIVDGLQLVDTADGTVQDVLFDKDNMELKSGPLWSPDGLGFAAVFRTNDDADEQAFYYDVAGQRFDQLTDEPEDVEQLQWLPDGSGLTFMRQRRPEEEIRRLRSRDYLIRDYETREPKQIWRYDPASRESAPLVQGDFFVREYALSRDGAQIIYLRATGGLGDDLHGAELWLYSIADGTSRKLTENNYAERSAKLSPNNSAYAFIATVNAQGEEYYEDNLFLQKIGDSKPVLLMPDLPLEVLDFAWDSDGKGLYVLGNSGLRTELYHYRVDGGALTRLTSGDHAIGDWTYDYRTDRHVGIVASAENPGEVFRFDRDAGGLRQTRLTAAYADWPTRFILPHQEAFSWSGRDGQMLEGLLVYPIGYRKEQKFPLVTITHGGPRSSSQFGSWNDSRFVAVLAGQGYGVFLPNHRGGTGYGDAFMRDMVGGYFVNAHHDVLDGIDALVARGLADPDQLVKMGWSAGGHMTNKLITMTDRFKAASSGAGASDWLSMFGESDNRHGRVPWFGDAPWVANAPIETYRKQSSVQDAWKVTTPTLFYVGENDDRVPPTQSILMYRAVKAAGADTRLYVADGEPHNFGKPSHRLFKINSDLEWFARHLRRPAYQPVLPDEAMAERQRPLSSLQCSIPLSQSLGCGSRCSAMRSAITAEFSRSS